MFFTDYPLGKHCIALLVKDRNQTIDAFLKELADVRQLKSYREQKNLSTALDKIRAYFSNQKLVLVKLSIHLKGVVQEARKKQEPGESVALPGLLPEVEEIAKIVDGYIECCARIVGGIDRLRQLRLQELDDSGLESNKADLLVAFQKILWTLDALDKSMDTDRPKIAELINDFKETIKIYDQSEKVLMELEKELKNI